MTYSKQIKVKKGPELWEKAKKIIPGGSQLLSKRSEMFLPSQWPSYFTKAKGVEVTDLDGNTFIDMSIMGIGACTLGYADPDVNKAVAQAVRDGSMCTLNSPEEVELAELLCELHPWASMVRYARTGGEAMAIAVRIARVASGRERVAFCGYHGWSDWYLAANLADEKNLDGHLLPGLDPRGVPRGLQGTALPFHYNKIEELEKLIAQYPDIGVIAIEPLRHHEPENNFLGKVRSIASKIKAVLIFDEMTIAWRMNVGGVHMLYKVYPDIAVFGKTMSNGYPMAAIIGKGKVMQAAQKTFISSTYWTERVGFASSLATLKKMRDFNIPAHLDKIGRMIGEGWKKIAEKHGLKISILGPNALITFSFDYGKDSQAIKTLFTQEMLKRGFLASTSVYVSYSHTVAHVARYLKLVDEVFGLIVKAIAARKVHSLLKGAVAHSDFKRLT